MKHVLKQMQYRFAVIYGTLSIKFYYILCTVNAQYLSLKLLMLSDYVRTMSKKWLPIL